MFVVRDDDRRPPSLFQSSVTTFAAYNNWGGRRSTRSTAGARRRARSPSIARTPTNPYGVRLDGAGDFLRRWEYNAVRFLEREGYDVAYTTDVDTHQPAPISSSATACSCRSATTSTGRRPCASTSRPRATAASISAFLGADACFWQIRFEADTAGAPDRTIVAYKDAVGASDPLAADPSPTRARLRHRPLARRADLPAGGGPGRGHVPGRSGRRRHRRRRGRSLGVRGDRAQEGRRAARASRATRSTRSRAEAPPVSTGSRTRRSRARSGATQYADMTIHEAPSGALVFATGSMQWSWGLDGYNAPRLHTDRVSAAAQRIMRNVLARMLGGRDAEIAEAEGAIAPSAPALDFGWTGLRP